MKKILITALAALGATCTASAQMLKEAAVPAAVKLAFTKQYPNTIAKWEKENGKFEAGFKKDGSTMSVLFEPNGTMVETETDIKVAALPPAVLSYVKQHYKGKPIKEGAKITKADGTINYEAEVGGVDVIFDGSGKFLKEAKG